jgi:hypothetical protein
MCFALLFSLCFFLSFFFFVTDWPTKVYLRVCVCVCVPKIPNIFYFHPNPF